MVMHFTQSLNLAIAIIVLSSAQNLAAQPSKKQTASPLKQLLWKYVEHCAGSIEEKEDGKIIDDSKNGYMAAYWSGPPCGCACASEAGAYKTQKGEYAILAVRTWVCEWTEELISNRPLSMILPEGWGFAEFNRRYQRNPEDTIALFYLHVEIPRKGTVTNVSIKPVPIGLNIKSSSVLVTSIGVKFGRPVIISGYVHRVIDSLSSAAVLTTFLRGEYSALKKRDKQLFESLLSTTESENQWKTLEDVRQCLRQIYRAYELYKTLDYDMMVLDWNKSTERFVIKEKALKNNAIKLSFKEFIKKVEWYDYQC